MELPRAQYSQEFREQSVKFFKESGLTLVEAAKRLSLPESTLKNWVYADKRGELALVGKHQKPLTEVELELSRVKRELAEVKMERDFIKKCVGDSTGHCNTAEIFCDGDKKFNVFLGRSFNSSAIMSSCSCE
ncbi:transposase [Nitrosomonas ureae]|uniref:Transposase n=1 Tax=Nitrosomonas ureae TaxID=44577 RepID=A0A1H2HS72_9PROT|nr:transposase [Nitrosomonas ureae]